ncbi:MAG: endolytic transglycosylase MltG [Aeriscardovia sp.]|nr:endolytic transglycosylase MltG [Aeriscardovia sp.]
MPSPDSDEAEPEEAESQTGKEGAFEREAPEPEAFEEAQEEREGLDDFQIFEQQVGAATGAAQGRWERRQSKKAKKRKIITVCIICAVFALIVAAGGIATSRFGGGLFSWFGNAVDSDYSGPGYGSVDFTINPGEGTSQIAQGLVKAGIVASVNGFVNAVESGNDSQSLQPGTFALKYHMSSSDVLSVITDPSKAMGMLVFTSAMRATDMIPTLLKYTSWTKSEIESALNGGGKGILPASAGGSFEGWLEPGTYDPKSYQNIDGLLKAMVDARISELNSLGVPTGAQREKILKIASIIGQEVNQEQYYGKVSRVIYNRLSQNMVLGMDSVIAYGFGVQAKDLTESMLTDASNPYNDRLHQGLPPTPISNPGPEMIKAAMNPTPGNWIYFVTVNLDTGQTYFTDSEQQFQAYKAQYEKWQAANPSV